MKLLGKAALRKLYQVNKLTLIEIWQHLFYREIPTFPPILKAKPTFVSSPPAFVVFQVNFGSWLKLIKCKL